MSRLRSVSSGSARGISGFSYVVVLMFITVMTVLGLSFLSKAGIGTSATLNRASNMQAEYLAEAAANHAMWKLLNDPAFPAAGDRYYMHSLAGGRYGYMVRRHTDSTFATVAAVGAVGESVVKRSYVLNAKYTPGQAQMVTGTYVGDDTDNRPIAVGFRPDVVIVKTEDSKKAVIRTSSMMGDLSKEMTGTRKSEPDKIQSLDPNGFTVGTHETVNKIGKPFHWAAFRAVAGQMKVGTYIGDETVRRAIGGMCFTPSLVIVFTDEGKEVVHSSDYSGDSFDFDHGNSESDCILHPFPSDGFRVGKNDRVNKLGFRYHYVCWPNIAGQQKFDGYVGDGVDGRDIVGLGFMPEYVIVRCVTSGKHAVHYPASLGGAVDNSLYFAGKSPEPNRIQALLADGFQVGDDDDVNKGPSESYAYFAWARK